ncbi:putative tricarboxylic transport membrane protein [Bradyrhizobium elkanii]
MEAFGLLLHGFAVLLTWKTLLLMMVGLVLGIFVGVLPGLGGPNGVAILLPLTFTMDPTSAIVMLSCIYWGALFGGAITSILFNIPGEAWSVATTFDGYPMAQQGRAAEALTAAFTSSFVGSLVAVLLITFLAPMISSFALRFGPPEFFAVYLLTFCSFVGLGREAKHKTVISMSLGLLLAGVGMDTVSGQLRMTFGSAELLRGINFLVAVIGLFGISEILLTMEERLALRGHAAGISLRVVLSVWKDLPKYWVTLLRSSVIGCWLGITPGGAIAASFMGYNLAKRFAKDQESFGKGRIEGVFAPETAAHASGTSALLPMLALGIPGSGTAAILLGGLMVWGLNPGPLLFVEHKDFVWGLIASMYLGNVVGLVLGADHGADLRLDPARAVRGRSADDRGVLRDRRLCDPECDVRYLADAGLRRRRLCLQEDRDSTRAVHPRIGARQPRRGCVPPLDDRLRRRHEGVLVERPGRHHHDTGDRAAVLAGDRQGVRRARTNAAACTGVVAVRDRATSNH